jgi:hypothetical protein
VSGPLAPNRYTSATSNSGTWPSVAEKRISGAVALEVVLRVELRVPRFWRDADTGELEPCQQLMPPNDSGLDRLLRDAQDLSWEDLLGVVDLVPVGPEHTTPLLRITVELLGYARESVS